MNKITKNILIGIFVFLALASLLSLYNLPAKKPQKIDLGTMISQINQEQVKAIEVKGDQLNITLNNGDQEVTQKDPADSISALLKNLNADPIKLAKININVADQGGWKFWLSTVLPLVLPILFIVGFLWFMMRQVQGANSKALNFGQSRAREFNPNQATRITFKEVAGVKEAKQELVEVVDFLKNPKKYLNLGARIPKGVLLVGAPGTGKTLLAKAVAGEANVPFFTISGSEFVEMFVGVGASVTGDTPVLVKTEKEGIRLRPIAEIVDRYYQDGESNIVKKTPGLQTLGLAPLETNFRGARSKDKLFFGGSRWSGVKGVLRHMVDEVYTIHYRGGKIRTTGDHSIFVRDGNMVRAKKAVELKTGDILANLPFKVRGAFVPGLGTTHIVRHHEFKKDEGETFLDLYGGELLETEKKYSYALEMSGMMSQYAIAERVGVSQATVGNWQNRVHRPQFLSNTLITASTSSRLKITADLLRLMGYYAAEGRVTKYYTQFVFGLHEANLHADCEQLIRNIFKVEPNITEMEATNSLRITVSSPIVSRFFEKQVGTGSKNKHLPQFLWTASKDFFLAFLNGYSRGDGYTTRDGKLSITSVSKQIIRELAWLASMHGIQTGIRRTVTPAGRTIKGGQPLPETVAWNLIIGKSSHPFRPYEGTVNQFKKTTVQKIEKTPYDGYVYDFCGCDHEAFFGGDKPILLHNSRVRDLFARAKKYAPCIVFIDELDAVGRQRGAGLGGSHDEREQTLNQILVEMDGFEANTNVIVMAATNRPDVLDTALLRPGRFDRQVTLDLPDINDREDILKVHAREKPFAPDVNLRQVAERTPGFSGAELANLLNEAAILTALQNRREITGQDILISIDKILLGPERKSHILNADEKKITAYHEAGHALVAHGLPHVDPIRKISIVARGLAAGFTLKLPSEDRRLHSRSEFLEELAVLLGGRVAEEEIFHDITTGAQNDLREATKLAKQIITEYGMSDLGLRTFGQKEELIFLGRELHEQRDYSEKSAEDIDKQINRLLEQATKTARAIINDQKKYLDRIAAALLEKETIETEEFEALFKKEATAAV